MDAVNPWKESTLLQFCMSVFIDIDIDIESYIDIDIYVLEFISF